MELRERRGTSDKAKEERVELSSIDGLLVKFSRKGLETSFESISMKIWLKIYEDVKQSGQKGLSYCTKF